jgi:hypothetical protein
MNHRIWFCLVLLLVVSSAYAHQPRIVPDNSLENPVIVLEPEISKAYYGELTGEPHYFLIESGEPFSLYLNILAPDLPDSRTDFIVEVIQDSKVIYTLKDGEWTSYFEEFARDYYLLGPELEEQVNAGTYYVKVSNPDNLGKYSLAVGKIESFPLSEIINTFKVLPQIKNNFFNKSPASAFFNVFSLYLIIPLLLIIAALYIVYKKYFIS